MNEYNHQVSFWRTPVTRVRASWPRTPSTTLGATLRRSLCPWCTRSSCRPSTWWRRCRKPTPCWATRPPSWSCPSTWMRYQSWRNKRRDCIVVTLTRVHIEILSQVPADDSKSRVMYYKTRMYGCMQQYDSIKKIRAVVSWTCLNACTP